MPGLPGAGLPRMLSLDVLTASAFAASSHAFMAATLAFYGRLQKTYEGFQHWSTGALLTTAGLLGLVLRPLSELASIALLNGLVELGLLVGLDGTLRFVGRGRLAPAWYSLAFLLAAAQLFFATAVPDIVLRQWLFTAVAGGTSTCLGAVLLRGARPDARRLYRAAAAVQFVLVAAFVVRTLGWTLGPTPAGVLEAGTLEVGFLLFLIATDLCVLAGFLLLNSQRLEAELRDSQAVLEETLASLRTDLAQLKALSGILPVCSGCRKVRDAEGAWHPAEQYMLAHTEADFSHTVCPRCFGVLYPEHSEILEEL